MRVCDLVAELLELDQDAEVVVAVGEGPVYAVQSAFAGDPTDPTDRGRAYIETRTEEL